MAVLILNEAEGGIQSVNMVPAAGGGDSAPAGVRAGGWDLPVLLLVRNTDAATKTVTVDGVGYIVPATTGLAVIPLRRGALGTLVPVTYSAVTGVTVAAIRLSRSD